MAENDAAVQDTVYCVADSPNFNVDRLCFAACESGLYRSTDGGATWANVYGFLPLDQKLSTPVVAFSPDFASDHEVFAGVSGGILRSSDGGNTWYANLFPSPPPLIVSLAISPNFTQDGILLAGTLEDGVLSSTDRGGQWAPWNFGLLDLNTYDLAISPNFEQDETVFVATESGIFRSTNGGRAWRGSGLPLELAPVIALAISPNYAQDHQIYAGTEAHGLFHSIDQGKSWLPVGKNAIKGAVNKILLPPTYAQKPQVLILNEDILMISSNGGAGWSTWRVDIGDDTAITTMTAPYGLARGEQLLVGLSDGQPRLVSRVTR